MSPQMGRHLVGSGRPGCIINLASTHAIVGFARRSAYGIPKATIIHMTTAAIAAGNPCTRVFIVPLPPYFEPVFNSI